MRPPRQDGFEALIELADRGCTTPRPPDDIETGLQRGPDLFVGPSRG
jgi:hypothetical protein